MTRLLLSGILIVSASWATSERQIELQGTQFLSRWPGYQDSLLRLKGDWTFESDQMRGSLAFEVSNEKIFPVLGNLRQLLWRKPVGEKTLEIGRLAPRDSYLKHYGVADRINHSICSTALDCYQGGPLGIGLRGQRFRVFASLINLPDIRPAVEIDSRGAPVSASRWADIPVSHVLLEDHEIPLRSSGGVADGLSSFVRPGLLIENVLYQDENIQLSLRNSYMPSPRSVGSSTDTLSFENGDIPDSANVVVHHEVKARFPYQQIHSLQFEAKLGPWSLQQESAYLHRTREAQYFSHLSRAKFSSENFSLSLGAGVYAEKGDGLTPLVQGQARYTLGIFYASMLSDLHLRQARNAIFLEPEIGCAFSKSFSSYLKARLIKADAANFFWGPFRGNDQVLGGLRYAF